MSVSFASDIDNEFVLSKGEFVLVENGAETAQAVREILLSYQDDFFLDRSHGLPYFQTMFTKPINLNLTETLLKNAILNVDGVRSLLTFQTSFDPLTRKLSVNCSFETTYGDVQGVTINA